MSSNEELYKELIAEKERTILFLKKVIEEKNADITRFRELNEENINNFEKFTKHYTDLSAEHQKLLNEKK